MKTIVCSALAIMLLSFLTSTTDKNPLARINLADDFVEVPSGVALVDEQLVEVESFYVSRYEVSNRQYQAFIDDLVARNEVSQVEIAQIQAKSWTKTNPVNDFFSEHYYTYKGFADFPVVNISYEAANLYCQWLTEQINSQNNTNYDIEVRLPTREQWIRAARSEDVYATYAWGSPYLRDDKGHFLCNFKRLGSEQIYYNKKTQTYEIVKYDGDQLPSLITDRVDEYQPNDLGLYNICGNVAEMIIEPGKAVGGSWNDPGYDVRVESIDDYTEASPFVGFRPVLVLKEK